MRFGNRFPRNITWSIAGTGAAFGSDVRLSNGQPSEVTAIEWLTEVSPSITDYVDIRADWTAPVPVKSMAILNLDCPAGVRIVVTGRRNGDPGYAYDLGGNSQTARTKALPDGRVQLILNFDELIDDLVGYQVRIYNDDNGSTWADDTTELRIGEIAGAGTVPLKGRPGWKRSFNDPTERMRTQDGGIHTNELAAWRILKIDLAPDTLDVVRQLGLADGEDWETLEARNLGDSRCLVIVRTDTDDELNRTAIYGFCQFEAIEHVVLRVYEASLTVEEVR